MEQDTITIIYLEFLDHTSHSNIWQDEEEYKQNCVIEPTQAVGILENEDKLAFYLSTMKGLKGKEKGSGHTILKGDVYHYKKIPLKIHFKNLEDIMSRVMVEMPLVK